MTPEITATGASLGAFVRGVDLGTLDDRAFAAIEAAWHTFAVLIFPEQHVSDAAQIAFSRRFGSLERSLTAKNVGGNPEVIVLSNVKDDGGVWPPESEHGLFLKGNCYWHTDSSYKSVPAKGSMLAAKIVTAEGGETEFADMRAAYDVLAPAKRDYLQDKIAVHSYAYSQGLVGGTGALSQAEWDALPPVEHPVIRTHADTGRQSLYLGRHTSHLVGEDVEESRGLLQRLCAEACNPPRTYKHTWRAGDAILWDNRCVLHRGHDYPGDQARHMVRTTIAGDSADNAWRLSA